MILSTADSMRSRMPARSVARGSGSRHRPPDAQEALTAPEGDPASSGMIEACGDMLRSGKIIALKGLGGFHLACDATNPQAVQRLRERKRRPAKPFAVMMASLEEIRQHGRITPLEEEALNRPSCPIVLISWARGSTVAREAGPRKQIPRGDAAIHASSSSPPLRCRASSCYDERKFIRRADSPNK